MVEDCQFYICQSNNRYPNFRSKFELLHFCIPDPFKGFSITQFLPAAQAKNNENYPHASFFGISPLSHLDIVENSTSCHTSCYHPGATFVLLVNYYKPVHDLLASLLCLFSGSLRTIARGVLLNLRSDHVIPLLKHLPLHSGSKPVFYISLQALYDLDSPASLCQTDSPHAPSVTALWPLCFP